MGGMRSSIEVLPVEVVHLMAAGEVIDSLAAVVRELGENALDAGATRIAISLWTDQWRVRVADNGIGMSLPDLQQAASPHSTSKIRDRADLWQITSLGFRGEALYSLAQLAELEIASRATPSPTPDDSPMEPQPGEGWLVTYNPWGQAVETQPVAIATGTIVTVNDLFTNLPTRRQGLPPLSQQMKAIQATIHQLALCHPQVTWQVKQNERNWFTLFPGTTACQILPQILKDIQVQNLRELELEADVSDHHCLNGFPSPQLPSLYLLLGLPDRCHRHRADWIRVAVNGRFVRIPELEQAILMGFRRTLPRDRYPICIVQLQVPPQQVDWNRHPAKAEVYLHDLNRWAEMILAAIEQALQLNLKDFSESFHANRLGHLLKTAEATGTYGIGQTEATARPAAPGEEPSPASGLSGLKAIAQVHNTYILAEHPDGIWLIEQHIAHERVLYEQLGDRWEIVPLPAPVILNQLTAAQVEQLQRIGLDVEVFGEQTWVVRSAPDVLVNRPDCSDALLELSLGGDLPTVQAAIACRSAIRNGDPLSLSEMQRLLNQWQQTRNPRTCPHGRPICLTLAESSLSRFFRRHWMIGKSHGLR
jgi:DNA mismatch repair protein MutL